MAELLGALLLGPLSSKRTQQNHFISTMCSFSILWVEYSRKIFNLEILCFILHLGTWSSENTWGLHFNNILCVLGNVLTYLSFLHFTLEDCTPTLFPIPLIPACSISSFVLEFDEHLMKFRYALDFSSFKITFIRFLRRTYIWHILQPPARFMSRGLSLPASPPPQLFWVKINCSKWVKRQFWSI